MNNHQTIKFEVADRICTITLNRPDSLNAMNRQLIDETAAAFNAANHNDDIGVIIFTGSGRAFCAGDDRKAHTHPENETQARDLVESIQDVTRAIVLNEKLVIGAINGWAVGGGFEWAINCDFPIWARSAQGFFPEVSLNLFVTGGVTSLLPALIGLNKAREMLILGEKYDADTLKEMGVAWRVVEDQQLMGEAYAVAKKIVALPPKSCSAMKRVLYQTAVSDLGKTMALETEATVKGFMDFETTKLLKDF